MTKMTFALAAALLAGTTLTSTANAGGIRLGFGFPLGSFIAHSNQNYGPGDYRGYERPRYVRRDYQDDAPARRIAKVKRTPRVEVADTPVVKAPAAPIVKTAKLEDKLGSDPATTTVIEKTPAAASGTTPAKDTTTASTKNASTTTKTDNEVATVEKTGTTATDTETKHICRRYSAAIAGLVDVPCE